MRCVFAKRRRENCFQHLPPEPPSWFGNDDALQLDRAILRLQPSQDHVTSRRVISDNHPVHAVGIPQPALVNRDIVASDKTKSGKSLFQFYEIRKVTRLTPPQRHNIAE